jgi:UDP-sulfoquinovose synthase
MRIYNQFTEQFTVTELAEKVREASAHLGWDVEVAHAPNPRIEAEEHYYNAKHQKLLELGLEPHYLGEELIDSMLHKIERYRDRIDRSFLVMGVRWAPTAREKTPA